MSDFPVETKIVAETEKDIATNIKPEPIHHSNSSVATASSSDKDASKPHETSNGEKLNDVKAEKGGKDPKGGDETDYSSNATRKTEFKHFLVR